MVNPNGNYYQMNLIQWMKSLNSAKSKKYSELRDIMLQDSELLQEYLNQKLDSSASSIDIIQYEIIAGWKYNGSKYEKFISDIKSIDYETERKKISGIAGVWWQFANVAKKEYGNLILPLCWEVLLKYGNDWNTSVINVFITATEYIPDRKSIDVLLRYMETVSDDAQIRFAGNKLGYLAASLSEPGIKDYLEKSRVTYPTIIEGINEAIGILDEKK